MRAHRVRDFFFELRPLLRKRAVARDEFHPSGRGYPRTRGSRLARYGQLRVLERLQQTAGRPEGPPAVLVLPAADGQHQLPMIDGQALPVISSNQWIRVPQAWIQQPAG